MKQLRSWLIVVPTAVILLCILILCIFKTGDEGAIGQTTEENIILSGDESSAGQATEEKNIVSGDESPTGQATKEKNIVSGDESPTGTTSEEKNIISDDESPTGTTTEEDDMIINDEAPVGTALIGMGNTADRRMTLYAAEMVPWVEVDSLWKCGEDLKVYDVKTGKIWWARRWAGGPHADVEPLTAEDTAILCEIYGVSSASGIGYECRPCLITIGIRTIACSLYGEEHDYPDGDTIPDNDYNGHACIHFKESTTTDTKVVDRNHQEAIQYAWENCPVGHK